MPDFRIYPFLSDFNRSDLSFALILALLNQSLGWMPTSLPEHFHYLACDFFLSLRTPFQPLSCWWRHSCDPAFHVRYSVTDTLGICHACVSAQSLTFLFRRQHTDNSLTCSSPIIYDTYMCVTERIQLIRNRQWQFFCATSTHRRHFSDFGDFFCRKRSRIGGFSHVSLSFDMCVRERTLAVWKHQWQFFCATSAYRRHLLDFGDFFCRKIIRIGDLRRKICFR